MVETIFTKRSPLFFLAPLSGITDLSFRLISRANGASYCFFEMLDARSLVYNHPRSQRTLNTIEKDRPIAAQLLGSDPGVMLRAAQEVLKRGEVSFIDINAACPARKVLNKSAGASLLKNRKTLGNIVKKMARNLRTPVTVKLRTGFSEKDVPEIVRTAQVCQENGASLLFLHGRTASQGYAGTPDYESIKAVKEAVTIPVIGSGNILDHVLAERMIGETNCDGLLIARGALGNPWIFKSIQGYLKKGTVPKQPALIDRKKMLKKHLFLIERYKDAPLSYKLGFMMKTTMWYVKGMPNASRIRERIGKMKSYKALQGLVDTI